MSFTAGMGPKSLIPAADNHHKMILLIRPNAFIHENDQGDPLDDILSNILRAPGILDGLQALLLSVNNHVKVQGPPGALAVNGLRDFFWVHGHAPEI